jgi:hypothetical protein
MRRSSMFLAVVVLSLAAAGIASAQTDPRIGTWKLNVAKSKFDAAAARQSETRTYEASGSSVMARVEATTADGTKSVASYDATPDGKDHPYTNNPFGADTLSTQRKGNGFVAQSKKGGKLLYSTTNAVSADGKVLTLTNKGVNANGQSINSVRVYDKQ